jgi:tRNA(fMet)-specific endonuclease VapC
MAFLFDTDVLSALVRPHPSALLVARLRRTPPGEQFTSAITVAELYYGAQRTADPAFHRERIESLLLPRVLVLPFDAAAAVRCGELRAALEKRGAPLAWADLQIAAIALVFQLTLVTGNRRHFDRVAGLVVEDWIRGSG